MFFVHCCWLSSRESLLGSCKRTISCEKPQGANPKLDHTCRTCRLELLLLVGKPGAQVSSFLRDLGVPALVHVHPSQTTSDSCSFPPRAHAGLAFLIFPF